MRIITHYWGKQKLTHKNISTKYFRIYLFTEGILLLKGCYKRKKCEFVHKESKKIGYLQNTDGLRGEI